MLLRNWSAQGIHIIILSFIQRVHITLGNGQPYRHQRISILWKIGNLDSILQADMGPNFPRNIGNQDPHFKGSKFSHETDSLFLVQLCYLAVTILLLLKSVPIKVRAIL